MNLGKLTAATSLLAQATALLREIEAEERGTAILGNGDTSANDPLAPNCRQHTRDGDGHVKGIHITLHRLPGAKYRVVSCRMLGVEESGGNPNVKVAVLDRQGKQTFERAMMGTGYQGQPQFDQLLPPGNPQNNFFMGRDGKFTPPNLGPLGFVVVDGHGQIISDAVCSWGLPYGQHIGGIIVFQEV